MNQKNRRKIGEEIVLRVCSTGSGVKVVEYDGTGLAEGIMSKHNRRYCYGDDAAEKASRYAEETAENLREQLDVPVTVVDLGQRVADRLEEVAR